MIKFTNFIKDFTEGKDLSRIKLKFHKNADFCSGEKDTTQYLFEDDESKESVWTILNSWRGNSKNKETSSLLDYCDYLITFSQYNLYGSDFYIFGGIYEIKKAFPEKYGKNGYDIKLLKDYKEYRKRLIVKFKTGRVFERWYLSLQDNDIEIFELFPDIASEKFNGYQNVSIVYKNLKIALNDPTWIGALKNVKAIYAITDISNGKLYIGSACGNTGLFGRWSDYINNLTGGNQEFEDIKKINGEDYIKKNFKYSILEIFDTKTKQEYILERENYWKNVFETKKFGMNWN
ncbi:GIY-YIG nuclease family protein [Fusobacterium nucleatum]|uniref:GIY-YIG nuclease family protein n=1 Tax=Fusobacterium TaxID=848 RepID=UPI001C6EB49F|nr:GIY-YIG nuclease family protein [Fusobacterium animalis]QYR63061.1 GIY-YIG nuclease family protein [Fusobacterium animalis]